jgi:ribulose-5-phosphate 4-epimerase/fuculose-1-phosphate aldolase
MAIVSENRDCCGLIARAVRILSSLDLMDMNGHVSARDPDNADSMWINSRRASRSTLRANDVIRVDLASADGPAGDAEPPSEYYIHRAILRRRPDVGAVVHSHPAYVVALSVGNHNLAPVTGVGSFLPEEVPTYDNAFLINSDERAEAVASLLGDGPAIVLRGHGIIVVGADVKEAVARYVCAEENAHVQYRASLLGIPHVLRGEELRLVRSDNWTQKIVDKHWHYHCETALRAGFFDGVD